MSLKIKVFLQALTIFIFQAIAFAQEAAPVAAEQPNFMGMLTRMAFMFLMVFLIFNLLVIKPQKNKLKEQQNLLTNLKRGDKVATTGGLCGRYQGTEKDLILLEIAPNVKVMVEAAHVVKKLDANQVEKAA